MFTIKFSSIFIFKITNVLDWSYRVLNFFDGIYVFTDIDLRNTNTRIQKLQNVQLSMGFILGKTEKILNKKCHIYVSVRVTIWDIYKYDNISKI